MSASRALRSAPIPTASMADVAFLLLLFFLVTTAIQSDAGLPLTLPSPDAQRHALGVPVTLAVLVDARSAMLLDGEPATPEAVRLAVAAFAGGAGRRVTLRTHRQTPYATYVAALDAVLLGHRDASAEVRLALLPPAE